MMLNDKDIRSYVYQDELISPFNKQHLQPASYDVTLDQYLVTFESTDDGSYIDGSTREYVDVRTRSHKIKEKEFLLQPGDFILGSTIEKVQIPDNIAARFEGKSSLGRIGLSTHVTAGFIDPGFRGNITLEIHNVNRVPIKLCYGMRIGQLCFFKLGSVSERSYGSLELGSHYQDQTGVTEARG